MKGENESVRGESKRRESERRRKKRVEEEKGNTWVKSGVRKSFLICDRKNEVLFYLLGEKTASRWS